jgi:hypothetical protein
MDTTRSNEHSFANQDREMGEVQTKEKRAKNLDHTTNVLLHLIYFQ